MIFGIDLLSSLGINWNPSQQYSIESSGLLVDDVKYVGSQVLYDNYQMNASGKTAILGAYNYDLIQGLFTGVEIPSAYERAYRVTAQCQTSVIQVIYLFK